MKKTRRFASLTLSLLFLAWLPGIANAAPYGPKGREITWTQPGGQTLKLRVFGDEYYARTETLDGYTVVFNPENQAYHYAELGAAGKALKPSGPPAHLKPQGLKKGIDLSADQIRAIRLKNLQKLDSHRAKLWNQRLQARALLNSARETGSDLKGVQAAAAKINAAPVEGDKVGLTILVEFPDDPRTNRADSIDFPTTRAKILAFCNSEGYNQDGNTGSVRDYFFDQSLGKVNYTQKVTTIVTLPNARNYYNYQNYPTNTILRDPGSGAELIINDAIASLRASGFSFDGLTVDGNNDAIATNIFYAGPDSGVWAQGLWPHQGNLNTRLNIGNGVYLNAYQITNIENAAPVIGTFVHENGHLLLNYPDLYSYIGDGEGVGDHCLMGGGNYNDDGKTPAPLNIYFKDIVGWADVKEVATNSYLTRNLPTTGNVGYRLRKNNSNTEYFVVENRGNGDKWAKYAVDKGIIIWHIDETIEGNSNRFGTDPHYGVSVEQADGSQDLEIGRNRGDTTDCFDLATPLFSDATEPNANWWDGTDSTVRVKVQENPGASVKVQFGNLPPNRIVLDDPNGGEVLYRDSQFIIRWEANIIGDVKIDLYKDGKFHTNIVSNTPNNGSYGWTVPADFKAGKGFRVRVSSISNPVAVFDASDETFEITDSTFPENNQMPYGWFVPTGADAGWQITNSLIYEGTHSLRSMPIGDAQTASIAYKSNFKAGTLSFYLKASTEVGYDYVSFSIDGVRQSLPNAISKQGLTGRTPWVFASFPISAGNHTFTWTYKKDDSYAEAKDAGFLDAVLLPPTTQEIAVESKLGLQLVSGSSKAKFPSVRLGTKSKPMQFTIKNNGKADLHGLKIVTKGTDAKAFIPGSLGKKALKPGQSTTFEVVFAPSRKGAHEADIRIISNDDDESPFVIKAEGRALGVPELTLFQPSDEKLKDGKSLVKFGYSTVGVEGKTRVFTVKNTGNAPVKGLKVSKSGPNKGDFSVYAIGTTRLAPGESTTFKVTFTPGKKDQRLAELHVTCDYKPAGSFDVKLSGEGVPKNIAQSASRKASLVDAVLGSDSSDRLPAPVVGSVVIGGSKYATLTYAKPLADDGLARTVEVSSNLVDWFSGAKHTTIVSDNESFRTVRDNVPASSGAKRHIRLKVSRR